MFEGLFMTRKNIKGDKVVSFLQEAIQTRVERHKIYQDETYGGAYKQHGHVMAALFPNGTSALSALDQSRLANLNMIVGKLVRYCSNFNDGGHDDSMKDLAVYTQMQRELDEFFKEDLK